MITKLDRETLMMVFGLTSTESQAVLTPYSNLFLTECPNDGSLSIETETSLYATAATRKKIVFPVSGSTAQFREYTGSGALMVSVRNGSGTEGFVVLSKEQKEALTEYLTGGLQSPTYYRLED